MICLRTGLPNFLSAQMFATFQLMTFHRHSASRLRLGQPLKWAGRARSCFSLGKPLPTARNTWTEDAEDGIKYELNYGPA